MRAISLRQESEHQGVQEAQMMQAMEFNSAWSQNMTEFERQAREIEEGAIRRHQEEFAAFQQKLYGREPHSYKWALPSPRSPLSDSRYNRKAAVQATPRSRTRAGSRASFCT